jgi:hypothetical protein
MAFTIKTIKPQRKKLKNTIEDGKTYNAHGLAALMLKLLYYQKQCTDSMQSLATFKCHFSQKWKNQS